MRAIGSQIGFFIEREESLTRERRARSEAETASRAKDEFLAMLGHELRNPLGAIASAVSLLGLIERDSRTALPLEIMARQVGNLTRLVDDLLDVSRVTSGRVDLKREPVDLEKLVEASVSTLRAPSRNGGHQFSVTTASTLVDADPVRLGQIVMNLLDNAVKYTPPGGQIWVTVATEDGKAIFRVRDTGSALRLSSCRASSTCSRRPIGHSNARRVGSALGSASYTSW